MKCVSAVYFYNLNLKISMMGESAHSDSVYVCQEDFLMQRVLPNGSGTP
jgi:hypothetical protein